jgi:hypothetical protein
MPIAADKLWAMAARCRKLASETADPGLRNTYNQLTLGYTRLAVQREAIDRCRAPIGFATEFRPSVRATCLCIGPVVEP